ncbi:MAG: phenylacetate--CoA ligase family protein [Planctomycetaceae bacterium]|nr:MAG: phenylacetate--CoA ligase family protein [Planctomycetaceae bacterium]
MLGIGRDQFMDGGSTDRPEPKDAGHVSFESVEWLSACTNRLLADHVRYCYEHSRFYRQRFDRAGVKPQDVQCVADLRRLPLTTKADLAEHGDELLCVPESQVVDVCQTSGTTGAPVALLQTEKDLRRLAYNEQMCFLAAGLTARDRVLIACALDRCFMAGLAYFEGLRRIGATAIRAGAGSVSLVAEAILLHKPTAIIGVPSMLLEAGRLLRERGGNPAGLAIGRMICIGEPVRDEDLSLSALGRRLHDLWATQVLGTYASTEMATSFTECAQGRGGGHVLPDLIAVEILNEAGEPVPPGQAGEVVATPLQVTGMPLLRLSTGDIAALLTDACPCGRKTYRLGPVLGRKAQMLKVRGTTLYPPAIFTALQSLEGIRNYCLDVYEDHELSDRVEVAVGLEDGACLTEREISERIRGRVRVTLDVAIVPADEIQKRTRIEGRRKPVLVFDHRTRERTGLS